MFNLTIVPKAVSKLDKTAGSPHQSHFNAPGNTAQSSLGLCCPYADANSVILMRAIPQIRCILTRRCGRFYL